MALHPVPPANSCCCNRRYRTGSWKRVRPMSGLTQRIPVNALRIFWVSVASKAWSTK